MNCISFTSASSIHHSQAFLNHLRLLLNARLNQTFCFHLTSLLLFKANLRNAIFLGSLHQRPLKIFQKKIHSKLLTSSKQLLAFVQTKKEFSLPKRKKLAQQAVVLAHQEPLIAKSFATLINLTKLDLCWEPKSNCTSFFSNLGSSCPSLTHFKIDKLWLIGMEQALALVLGAKFDLFLESATRKAIGCLHSLQFDIDCVTPICQSLKSLQVYNQRSFDYRAHAANSSVKDLLVGLFPPLAEQIDFDEDLGDPYFWSVMAFILRHFHHLESVEIDYIMDCDPCKAILPQAVTLLHQALQSTEPVKVSSFASLKWTTNSHPTPTLNLRKMNNIHAASVSLRSQNMLPAVVSMCPLLEMITFTVNQSIDEDSNEPGPGEISPLQLQSMLKNIKWPEQLKTVRFTAIFGIGPEYFRVLLASIGDKFIKMEFEVCNINLLDLVLCTNLEVLDFGFGCELDSTPESALDQINQGATPFLPKLKELTVGCCMGKSSRLIETIRPSLIKVDLLCCHLENPLVDDLSSWEDLPDLWPNIQELGMETAYGLTMDMLRRIVPRLKSIQVFSLPVPFEEEKPTAMEKAIAEEYRLEQQHNSI